LDLTARAPACGCLGRTAGAPGDWGLVALRSERPRDARAAAAALAAVSAAGEAAWIVGSASRLAACPPVPAAAVVIETSGIRGVVAYEPADQTLTVRAGTPLEEVHALLAGDGLELPGAHFGLADGTVGGMVATDLADARRGRAGALRDRLLGMTVAGPDGKVTRSGGRVVKNVAGYDLMRLHGGAHGAFGLVAEVTLRLAPRPEAHAPFERGLDGVAAAADAAWRIAREAPALGLVGFSTLGGRGARLTWVHEGDREWVAAGARWSTDTFGAAGAGDDPDHHAPVEARLRLLALEHVCPRRNNVLVRGSLLPSRLPELARRLAGLALPALGGHAMTGAAFARIDLGAPDGPVILGAVTQAIEELGGAWKVAGAWTPADGPPGRDGVPAPWGGIATPWDLYARLKDAFDPARALGPAVYAAGGTVAGPA
jgi:glycolate oxidase FAD binding subunit